MNNYDYYLNHEFIPEILDINQQALLIKSFAAKHDLKVHLVDTDTKSLLNFCHCSFKINPDRYLDSLIRHFILQEKFENRKYSFNWDYANDNTDYEYFEKFTEKRKFYEIIKFYNFLTEPVFNFRTPVGIFTVDNSLHFSGRFRFCIMKFLPDDFKIKLLVSEKNFEFFKLLKDNFENIYCLNNASKEKICEDFNLEIFEKNTLLLLHTTQGMDFIELHSRMTTFKKDWIVEFANRCFYVNGVKVIGFKDNNFYLENPKWT